MRRESESKVPVTVPRQKRSTRTQQKILAIVEKHLLAGSFDQVTVQDLVAEAGCSVGAFYGRFANKAAAVYHFYDARCGELEVLATQILDPGRSESLYELLAEFTQTIVKRTFAYAAIIRSDAIQFTNEADNPFTLRARRLNTELLRSLHHCLGSRETEISQPVSHETALFVLAMIGGMSREAVIMSSKVVDDAGKLGITRFAQELTLAVTRYLGVKRR